MKGTCSMVKYLPDYAEQRDHTGVVLQKVGIKDVKVYRMWNDSNILTEQSAYVSLSRQKKGIHMSRLVRVLLDWETEPIERDDELLRELQDTHNESTVYWTCKWHDLKTFDGPRFTVFLELEGKLVESKTKWYLTIKFPYASVCPCSLSMVKKAREGVPHMQRSFANITLRFSDMNESLETIVDSIIVDLIEDIKLVPWGLMKRLDELNWCKEAERSPLFVEDAARKIAMLANTWQWFDDWVIVVEHQESIHDHDAVAIQWKGVELR